MSIDLRPLGADDLPALLLADQYGFGHRYEHPDDIAAWSTLDLDRAFGVFEGNDIVATGRSYALELTLPGPVPVPAAGISWVSVRPTHRRRGLLTAIMRELLADATAHGEPAAILTASEGGIYTRFGFGIAARVGTVRLDRERSEFLGESSGRVRLVEPADAVKIAVEVFDAARGTRPGAVSRPAEWWESCWLPREEIAAPFVVVYERDGRAAGLAAYRFDGAWSEGSIAKQVRVRDLLAVDPEAEAALWRYLCSIDLTVEVVCEIAPLDLELPFRLTDPRQARITSVRDMLWLRPLDITALLAARGYGVAERLVIHVLDDSPAGHAAGRFAIDATPDGAEASRVSDVTEADLTLTPDALGTIVLGDRPPSLLARAGRLAARDEASLARADRLFAAERSPCCATWF